MRARALAIAMLCASLLPARASACGGLFCSRAPVVQAGEEIVYAMEDDGSLTMSVRLFYAGSDPAIAWILPLPAPPIISIGTTALFTQLRASTAPAFVTTQAIQGACRPEPACVTRDGYASYGGGGCGYYPLSASDAGFRYVDPTAASDAGRVGAWDSGGLPDGGVVIFSREIVGPYDTVVLGAASATDVSTWLSTHGYRVPAGSDALLAAYANTQHVFVALRLAPGRTTNEIAPITLHLPVPAPCLPIRLTALATAPDLPITAWFLGRGRVVPQNYSIVELNYADERFWTPGFYPAEVTREIAAAGGQAFVTEYAGPTPRLVVTLPTLGDTRALSPSDVVQELLTLRYFATPADALRIVGAHVTPPPGMSLATWLACLSGRGGACGVPARADVAGLLAQCDTEILAPRRAAQAMIDAHPYLTRLFTSMSAARMTLDPEFRVDASLHDVPAVHEERIVTACDWQHYLSSAPTRTTIGTTLLRSTPGTIADDAQYCHARGLILPSEVPPPPHRGLCGCRAGHTGAGLWPYALAVGALGWARAWRRRMRRRD